jgi:hypothetical protein
MAVPIKDTKHPHMTNRRRPKTVYLLVDKSDKELHAIKGRVNLLSDRPPEMGSETDTEMVYAVSIQL